MYTRTTTIKNSTGLHARPAAEFVTCAAKFISDITIKRPEAARGVNAKSIIMLLTLALDKGSEIEISASGEDEEKAVDRLIQLVNSKFGED